MTDIVERLNDSLSAGYSELRKEAAVEIMRLRAKIAEMEQQEPARLVTATAYRWRYRGAVKWQYGELTEETARLAKEHNHEVQPLYALPGAQNAPVEQDEFVRKAWARFSNELHRSPGAPYPGMSEAFEQHFSQSFTDRDWRAESGTWAAAWKAAKRHGAQPAQSVPNLDMDALERQNDEMKEEVGRLRDALALIADQYEPKCNLLIPSIARSALCATGAYGQTEAQPTPNVPDGWQLVPIEPTSEMVKACASAARAYMQEYGGNSPQVMWAAMLAAAPEARP